MTPEGFLRARADLIASIPPERFAAARARLDSLTKPPGSLGVLEHVAARLSAIQDTVTPAIERPRVIVMAADHGVVAQGVSPYPAAVTAQMVANFLAGGAAVNQLAAWADADVRVVDIGVSSEVIPHPDLVSARVRPGTADMTQGPAMTREEAARAMGVGLELASAAADEGSDAVALGEMGIGNTTAAAAIAAAFTGAAPSDVVGPGTGLDAEGVSRKADAVTRALAVNAPDPTDALGVLVAVGGLEIAGLAGVAIGCAARGIPVVADGFISGAAALVAVRFAPGVAEYLFPSHVSAEPGHRVVLDALGLEPVLDLDMRLGEGTGAVLALGIMDAACRLMSGMATFSEAGVSDKD